MSNLLEQAIIDAAALKEVAIKNAEAALIEKYSKEFKESVEKLLEQEAAGGVSATVSTPADPTTGIGATVAEPTTEPFKNNIPSSFLKKDDDEELLTIDFDQIEKEVKAALGVEEEPETEETPEMETPPEESTEVPEQPDQNALMMEELELDEEMLEAYDLPQASSGIDMTQDGLYEEDAAQKEIDEVLKQFLEEDASTIAAAAANVAKSTGQLARDEEALQRARQQDALKRQKQASVAPPAQLEEELKVDLEEDHQLRGYMGTTNTERELARNVELAKARDAKAKEEREKELEEMADLKEKLEEAMEDNKKLSLTVEEFKKVLTQLKEHTEKLSVSNAKLLYTNKVLEDTSLNERQKEQIVESISKSGSVLEAKTIFTTLQSTVQSISEKKTKNSLSEALIRGNDSPFIVRKKQQNSSEDESFSQRMKKLAGIS